MHPVVIRVRRAALGLSQREVAVRAGIGRSRLSLIERGWVKPVGREVLELNRVLALSSDLAQLVVEGGLG